MGNSAKGSAYEREVCGKLSRWWTYGERDDVFWRSSGSGARATNRAAAGRQTYGQHGDIAATDPMGSPLTENLTIEIKRGYKAATIHDLLDRKPTAAVQEFEGFVLQASNSSRAAGSRWWMLITRRDRREALCWWPAEMSDEVWRHTINNLKGPTVQLHVPIKGASHNIHGATFDAFLEWCIPSFFKRTEGDDE